LALIGAACQVADLSGWEVVVEGSDHRPLAWYRTTADALEGRIIPLRVCYALGCALSDGVDTTWPA
jgi:hypothetical protein